MGADGGVSRRGLLKGAAATAAAGALAGVAMPADAAERAGRGRSPGGRTPRGEYVVRGADVITLDDELGDIVGGDVHVRDGAIVAVGRGLRPRGVPALDAEGMVAIPGIVETHWHLWTGLLRSATGSGPGEDYLSLITSFGPAYQPVDTYRAVRLGLAEALDAGITTVHDWSHNLRGPDWADASLRAHAESGVRARLSYGVAQGQDPAAPIDLDDIARVQRDWIDAGRAPLTRLGIAVRGPDASTPAAYGAEWEGARGLGLPLTMHALPRSNTGVIKRLAAEGLLGPDLQLVHAVYADETDRQLMAESGTTLSVSPSSELLFGWGPPQIVPMRDAGVLVSLSVDNTALAGLAEPFSIMRLTLGLAATDLGTELGLPVREALRMATIEGARDLGIDDQVGTLTPGKRADLVVLRQHDLGTAPTFEALQTVRSAQTGSVDTVIVDGVVRKRGGRLVDVDVDEVTERAARSAADLRARGQ